MIIVMKPDHTPTQAEAVGERLANFGLKAQPIHGATRTVIAALGQVLQDHRDEMSMMQGVDEVIRVSKPYKLSSRETHPADTVIDVGFGVKIGGGRPVFMAGPCSVETEEQLWASAKGVREAGAHVLRGGAFKPRSSPYAFQGLGVPGLKMLRQAGDELGMPVITECLSVRDIDAVAQYADIIQIGARNMQNFELLKEVGAYDKPVLLKRGLSATLKEFLLSAEYIMSRGNRNVILCERGIRTFETQYRNTLDLAAVPTLKELSHLPVIVDPSHATGKWNLVAPMAKAAVAAGADGLLIEVHSNPECALCDGEESIKPSKFKELMQDLRKIAVAVGREI